MAEMAEALHYKLIKARASGTKAGGRTVQARSAAPRPVAERRRRVRLKPTLSSLVTSGDIGDGSAGAALFGTLYADLRRLAQYELARRGGSVTVTATALLHEVYLDIATRDGAMFVERGRFMAYASRVMRGLIIDYVRDGRAQKRRGRFEMTTLEADLGGRVVNDRELTAISEALDQLAAVDRPLAEVVDLKFFCGFSFTEIAAMRGLPERIVQRQWDKARIYLRGVLHGIELRSLS